MITCVNCLLCSNLGHKKGSRVPVCVSSMVVAATLQISQTDGQGTVDIANVRQWAETFRKFGVVLMLVSGPDEGPWEFVAIETEQGFLAKFLGHAAAGTLPKCVCCVLRVRQAPAGRVLVMAKASGGRDVREVISGWDVVSHVLAYTAVRLVWLDVLPGAYLFLVEEAAGWAADINEVFATQILVAFQHEEVEVTLWPVASAPSALESALTSFPADLTAALRVDASDDEQAPAGRSDVHVHVTCPGSY